MMGGLSLTMKETRKQSSGSTGRLRAAHVESQVSNLRDPTSWVEPNAPGNWQAAASEVGGAHCSDEASNDRGAKEPYRTNA